MNANTTNLLDAITDETAWGELPEFDPKAQQRHDPAPKVWSDFGSLLFGHRLEAGLTQAQAAEYLKVHAGTVGRWERGVSAPNSQDQEWALETLFGLAELRRCEVDANA